MKNNRFTPLFALFFVLALLTSCAKDTQNRNSGDSSVTKDPANGSPQIPVYNYGIMKGILSPMPSYASITVSNDLGYSVQNTPAADGTFFISKLHPAVYNVRIAYSITAIGYNNNNNIHYYDIMGINVTTGTVTDLGTINLPSN